MSKDYQRFAPYPDLSGISKAEMVKVLENLVFTQRNDYRRPLWIDPKARDLLVAALRSERCALNVQDGTKT